MAADDLAPHTTDTHWHAVDAVGHVAVFISGRNGPLPAGAADAGYVYDLGDLTGWESEAFVRELAPDLGFFVYDHDSYMDPIEPYKRTAVPAVPVHIDQLPPAIRAGCRVVRFDGVGFSTAERVQPVEHGPCRFRDPPDLYVATDGRTVRSVPGREGRYAAAVAEFVSRSYLWASQYVFEPPTDGT